MNEVRRHALADIDECIEKIEKYTCKGHSMMMRLQTSIDAFARLVRHTRIIINEFRKLGIITDQEAVEQLERLKTAVENRIG